MDFDWAVIVEQSLMNKLMCRFEATTKKKKKKIIHSSILNTGCPQEIPRKNKCFFYLSEGRYVFY